MSDRKSLIGHRPLSRVPRRHRLPPWSTIPPIAPCAPMDGNEAERVLTKVIAPMRDLLIDVACAVANDDSEVSMSVRQLDDQRLIAVAREAVSNFKRTMTGYRSVESELLQMRKDMNEYRNEQRLEERALEAAKKALAERDDIAAKYKELQKQIDPERRQLEVMYAVDEATKAARAEASTLRRDLAQRQSEIDALKATKRKLREAMDRLADKG